MRLKTMHKRRKRQIEKKLTNWVSFECKGLKLKFSRRATQKTQLVFAEYEKVEIPASAIKSFDFRLNNSLDYHNDAKPGIRFENRETEINFSFKMAGNEFENLLNLFWTRVYSEKDEDGNLQTVFIHDTQDYKIFDKEIIE